MTDQGFKRKLTSIFSADAVGYSRLMEDDEEATVHTLTSYREVITTLIKQHNGIIVDSPGDNLLAEFVSVVNAVQCAVSVQNEITARNETLPEHRKMQFRIGINLGDVIQEGDRIYGDGINIAARLEGLAEPGGIWISKTAFDQIERKLPYGYEFIGEQTVKNISKPVGAYRLMLEPRVTVAGEPEKEKRSPVRRMPILVGAAVVLLLAIAAGLWQFYVRRPSLEPASEEKMAYPLPEIPSIAVLAFDNLSGDPEQEYFSDGITEEIITAISKTPKIFVIARNSTFTYKGKPVKVQQVAEDLGVRFVLEGSVRRADDKLRITAQLIDAINGRHLWAERYDRNLEDIFSVQDEIAKKIITELQVKLTEGEQARVYAKGTDNLEAYLKVLQLWEISRDGKPEDNALVRQLAEEAIALDPNWPIAYWSLGITYVRDVFFGTTKTPAKYLERSYELGQKALALDENLGAAHWLLSLYYTLKKQHEKAIEHGKLSVELDPNDTVAFASFARLLMNAGKPAEAIPLYKKAIRLDPYARPMFYYNYGYALWMVGQYEEGIAAGKEARSRGPNDIFSHILLAITYIELNRDEDARASAAEVLKIKPNITLAWLSKMIPWKNKDHLNRLIGDLRKAGLPE